MFLMLGIARLVIQNMEMKIKKSTNNTITINTWKNPKSLARFDPTAMGGK
jgi:hypothetical protein